MTNEVSWSAANVRRLQRHALHPLALAGTDPAEIAAVICGAHAQVLSAAELSLALRIQGPRVPRFGTRSGMTTG